MELNNINQDLKELYKSKEKAKSFLAFEFTCDKENERIIKLFKQGYWSVVPFAFNTYNNFAIKLNPAESIYNSSVVQINNSDGVTISNDLKTFLPLLNLNFLKNFKLIDVHFKRKQKDIELMSQPFREYTNGIDSLEFFYEYINDSEKLKLLEAGEKKFDQIYLDFWNHYNSVPEQKKYSDLIIKLVGDRIFYPDFNELEDYGIWNSRVNHALAQRAYGDLDAEFEKKEKHLWRSLTQSHGFNGLSQGFGLVPNPSSNSSRSILSIIDKFDPNPNLKRTFSKEILEHPLYDAIQELRVRKRGYMGEKHIEAAAILDTEHNDPYAAWDALVTASYWAGQAGSKAIEPMWEAAIYLSEKHNWTEIHEVLVQQYEYYNFYKDKV